MTNERHWLINLAGGRMQTLDELWSSEVTELRAAALISAAQQTIANAYDEAARKRARAKGRMR